MDPEALRQLMDRYFASVSNVIIEHGGVVEKFIGDAVMAVFGIPMTHEDDIVRAVRAGAAVRSVLQVLNEDFERDYGVRIKIRTGINYGEVVVGAGVDGSTYVTGDAVNVAARLEQVAEADAILVSTSVARLARSCAQLERLEPMQLKGKSEPIEVWALGDVAEARTHDRPGAGPLVGRDLELAALIEQQARAAGTDSTRVVQLLGPAGIGKSRLIREFRRYLPGCEVLTGQCLAYGTGATFWPLSQILEQLGGDGWEAEVGALLSVAGDRDLIIRRLAFATGRAATTATSNVEIAWAIRRLFEEFSRRRPLVVVWEDLQWAEPTLRKILAALAEQLKSAPVLMLYAGRPEHDDSLGTAGHHKIMLEPLNEHYSRQLASNMLAELRLGDKDTDAILDHVVRQSEGNPLYVQQLLAALDGGADGSPPEDLIPLSLRAILEAQLDRFTESERGLLARASVMGRDFWYDCLKELADGHDAETLNAVLGRLVRARVLDLDHVRRDGRASYRFCQPLMREIAYQTASKRLRSSWHGSVAEWFDQDFATEKDEYAALAAHHLAASVRLLREINVPDEQLAEMAGRAGERAWDAARLARSQGDTTAAAALFEQTIMHLPADDPRHVELAIMEAECRFEIGGAADARKVIDRTSRLLDGVNLEWAAFARVEHSLLDVVSERGSHESAAETAEIAEEYFSAGGINHRGLCRTHRLRAFLCAAQGRLGTAVEELQEAGRHASAIGDTYEELRLLALCCEFEVWGSTPVDQAVRNCRSLLARHDGDRQVMLPVMATLGLLSGLSGELESARAIVSSACDIARDLRLDRVHAVLSMHVGLVELFAGEFDSAEECFADGAARLRASADDLPADGLTLLAIRAKVEQGHWQEAGRLLAELEGRSGGMSPASRLVWQQLRARVDAQDGDIEHAEGMAREAVDRASQSDDLLGLGDALADLAHVLMCADRMAEAQRLFERAADCYASKGAAILQRRMLSRSSGAQ